MNIDLSNKNFHPSNDYEKKSIFGNSINKVDNVEKKEIISSLFNPFNNEINVSTSLFEDKRVKEITEEENISFESKFNIEPKSIHCIEENRNLSKEEDIKQKKGKVWTCIDRIVDPETGEYSYLFQIEKEFNLFQTDIGNEDYQKVYNAMFPAVEYNPFRLRYLDPNHNNDDIEKKIDAQIIRELERTSSTYTEDDIQYFISNHKTQLEAQIGYAQLLNKLGFIATLKEDGAFQLLLPSSENLLARWKMLQTLDKSLPPLSIKSSDGIAEDEEFINAFLEYDLLISNNKEMFHDLVIHGIPTLIHLLDESKRGEYAIAKMEFRNDLIKGLNDVAYIENLIQKGISVPDNIVKDLSKMKPGFSAVVDLWTANTDIPTPIFFYNHITQDIWLAPLWHEYWTKRFPGENIDSPIGVWPRIQDFIQKYKASEIQQLEKQLEDERNSILKKGEDELTIFDLLELQLIQNKLNNDHNFGSCKSKIA